MATQISLDRSAKVDFSYPIGVTETVVFKNTDIVTLINDYEIVLTDQSGVEFETIPDDGVKLTKINNTLVWVVDYEHGEINVATYDYELRDLTEDYIQFRGTFTVTKTLD